VESPVVINDIYYFFPTYYEDYYISCCLRLIYTSHCHFLIHLTLNRHEIK